MRNGNKKSVSFRYKKSCARAVRGVNLGHSFVVVCVGLFDDVDLARAADCVDAMALAVVENIIGIAGDVDLRNHFTRFRV